MPPGSQKPLFEVMRRDARARASERAAPTPPPEARAADRPAAAPEPAAAGPRVTVPLPTVYMTVALVIALCLVCFLAGQSLGYSSGYALAERETTEHFYRTYPHLRPDLQLTEPLAGEVALPANGPGAAGEGQGEVAPRGNRPDGGGGAGDPGRVITQDGSGVDPRVPGHNYLGLATLTGDEARATLAFLGERGMRAVAVRIDRAGGRGNTSPRYRLYALELAVPSERYREMSAQREQLQRRYREVGAELSRATNISNFSQTQWERR